MGQAAQLAGNLADLGLEGRIARLPPHQLELLQKIVVQLPRQLGSRLVLGGEQAAGPAPGAGEVKGALTVERPESTDQQTGDDQQEDPPPYPERAKVHGCLKERATSR